MNAEPDVLELLRKHSWHPIVQDAADEIVRLRAIVTDLAAAQPLARWRDYEEPYCTLCRAEGGEGADSSTVVHDPSCPWRRASGFHEAGEA